MTTRQRIVRSLNTRSSSGAIGVAEAKFSTGWSSATGTLISDDTLVETALKLVSTKLVRGDRLESPRATRQYLSLRFASLEHEGELVGALVIATLSEVRTFQMLRCRPMSSTNELRELHTPLL